MGKVAVPYMATRGLCVSQNGPIRNAFTPHTHWGLGVGTQTADRHRDCGTVNTVIKGHLVTDIRNALMSGTVLIKLLEALTQLFGPNPPGGCAELAQLVRGRAGVQTSPVCIQNHLGSSWPGQALWPPSGS